MQRMSASTAEVVENAVGNFVLAACADIIRQHIPLTKALTAEIDRNYDTAMAKVTLAAA